MLVAAQLLMAVRVVVVVEEVDMAEGHLRRLTLGDLGLPQDPGRQCRLLEGVDIGRGLHLTHEAGPGAHLHPGGEGEDDMMTSTTDDAAPAAIAMTATPDVEVAEVDRGIEEATVESMLEIDSPCPRTAQDCRRARRTNRKKRAIHTVAPLSLHETRGARP